jgi:hypothetical protein
MLPSEVEDLELRFRLQQKHHEHSSPELITAKLLVWAPETLACWAERPTW